MTALLLDNPRRRTAGGFETLLIGLLGAGFAVLPVLFLTNPQQVAELEWLVALPGVVVATVAGMLALWRLIGQETLALHDGHVERVWRMGPLRQTFRAATSSDGGRDLPYGQVEQQSTVMGFGHTGLILRCADQSPLRFGVALGGRQAEDLAERIRAALREEAAVEHWS